MAHYSELEPKESFTDIIGKYFLKALKICLLFPLVVICILCVIIYFLIPLGLGASIHWSLLILYIPFVMFALYLQDRKNKGRFRLANKIEAFLS